VSGEVSDSTDLAVVAKTPKQFPLTRMYTRNFLVIARDSLAPGTELMFSLNCHVGDPAFKGGTYRKASASISVTINSPPEHCVFTVANTEPSFAGRASGRNYALSDNFEFLTNYCWDDDDIIYYQYGLYLSTPGQRSSSVGNGGDSGVPLERRLATLRSRSEMNFADLQLPPGRSADANMVTTAAVVSDPFDAFTTLTFPIAVFNQEVKAARPKNEIADSIFSLLNSSSEGTVDDQWAAITLSTSVMITGECSAAPDCAALNREDCSTTDATCGECVEPEANSTVVFVGQEGHANTLCEAIEVSTMHSNTSEYATIMKSCPNDCSGTSNGLCVFKTTESDNYLEECLLLQPWCEAVCVCETGFAGPDCSYTDAQMRAIRTARRQVASRLQSLHSQYLDQSKYSLEGMVGNVAGLSNNPYEIDIDTALTLSGLTESLIADAVALDQSYESVSSLMDVLDTSTAVRSLGSTSSLSRRRRSMLQSGRDAVWRHRRERRRLLADSEHEHEASDRAGATSGGLPQDSSAHSVMGGVSSSPLLSASLHAQSRFPGSGGMGSLDMAGDSDGDEGEGEGENTTSFYNRPGAGQPQRDHRYPQFPSTPIAQQEGQGEGEEEEELREHHGSAGRMLLNEEEVLIMRRAVTSEMNLRESSPERMQEKKEATRGLEGLLRTYGDLVAASIFQGEYAVETLKSQFRMTTAAIEAQPADGNITEAHTIPRSNLEKATNLSSPTIGVVLLPNDSTTALNAVTKMSAIAIRAGLTGNTNFTGNPLKLHFSSLPCDPSSGNSSQTCEVDLVLPNHQYVNHTALHYEKPKESYCYFDEYDVHTVECDDGQRRTVECPGLFGAVITRCPYLQEISVCNQVNDSSEAFTSGCRVVEFSGDSTTCRCPVGMGLAKRQQPFVKPTSVFVSRRLSALDPSSEQVYDDKERGQTLLVDYGYLYDAASDITVPAPPGYDTADAGDGGERQATAGHDYLPVQVHKRQRRRLDSSKSELDSTFVSMTSNAVIDFTDTWSDVGKTRYEDALAGIQVIAFAFFLLGATLFGIIGGHYKDAKERQALAMSKKAKGERERRMTEMGSSKASFMRRHGDQLLDVNNHDTHTHMKSALGLGQRSDRAAGAADSTGQAQRGGAARAGGRNPLLAIGSPGGDNDNPAAGVVSAATGDEVRPAEVAASRPGTEGSNVTTSLLRAVGLHLGAARDEGQRSKIAPALDNAIEDEEVAAEGNHRKELQFHEQKDALAALQDHNQRMSSGSRKRHGWHFLSFSAKPSGSNAIAPAESVADGEVAVAGGGGGHGRRRVRNRLASNAVAPEHHSEELRAFHDRKKNMDAAGETEVRLVDESVPNFMRIGGGETFLQKIWVEIKENHRWISLYYHYDEDSPRAVRVLSMVSGVLVSLFTLSFLYGITNEDDGSCKALTDEAACLHEKSVFDSDKSKCHWYTRNRKELCAYSKPKDDVTIILYVTLAVALVAAPFLCLIEYVISEYIQPPTAGTERDTQAKMQKVGIEPNVTSASGADASAGAGDTVMVTSSGQTMQRLNFGDGADGSDPSQWYDTPRDLQMLQGDTVTADGRSDSHTHSAVGVTSLQPGSPDGIGGLLGPRRTSAARPAEAIAALTAAGAPKGASNVSGPATTAVRSGAGKGAEDKGVNQALLALQVKALIEPLNKDIHRYRRTLYACDIKDLEDFDEAWGLDYKGDISNRAGSSMIATLHRAGDSVAGRCMGGGRSQGGVVKRPKYYADAMSKISYEMQRVHSTADQEIENLRVLQATEDNPMGAQRTVGARIMYLFQRDLLTGLQSALLENKTSREGMYKTVPQAVPAWKKTLAWGFLITLDLFFGLYVVLFGLTQDQDLQQAWLLSLVMWLLLDILVFAAFACVVTHVLLPIFAVKGMLKVRLKLARELRKLSVKMKRREERNDLREQILAMNQEDMQKPSTISATAYRRADREERKAKAGRKVRNRKGPSSLASNPGKPLPAIGAAAITTITTTTTTTAAAAAGIAAGASSADAGYSSNNGDLGLESRPGSTPRGHEEGEEQDYERREQESRRRRMLRDQEEKLRQLEAVNSSDDDENDRNAKSAAKLFNAAKYFFVSYKLALQFPELRESKAVMRYSTQMPSDLRAFAGHEEGQRMEESQAGKTQHMLHRAGKKSLGFASSMIGVLAYSLMYVMGAFLSLPLLLQDFVVDEAVAALFGYLCVWHIWLWNVHPTVAFLPLVGFLFLGHFATSALVETMRLQAHNELKYDEERHNKFLSEQGRRSKQQEEEAKASSRGGVAMMNDPYAPRNVRDSSRRKRRRVKRRNPGSAAASTLSGSAVGDGEGGGAMDDGGRGAQDKAASSRTSTGSSASSIPSMVSGSSAPAEALEVFPPSGSAGSSAGGNSLDKRGRDRRKRRQRVAASMDILEGMAEQQNEDDDEVQVRLSAEEVQKLQEREQEHYEEKQRHLQHTQRAAAEQARMKIAMRAERQKQRAGAGARAEGAAESSAVSSAADSSAGEYDDDAVETGRDATKSDADTGAGAAVPSSPTGGLSIAEQMKRNRERMKQAMKGNGAAAGEVKEFGKKRSRRDRPRRLNSGGKERDRGTDEDGSKVPPPSQEVLPLSQPDSRANSLSPIQLQTDTPFQSTEASISRPQSKTSEEDQSASAPRQDDHNHGKSNTISW
jgi:hypothetical protein